MTWTEWDRVKAGAVERHGARTRLNQLPGDQGGASGTLVANRSVWTRAGADVGALREDIGKASAGLRDGQTGLGRDAGCLTAAAQREVLGTWETYARKVGARCEALSDLLVRAGREELRTEEAIEAEIARLGTAYADTAAVGGRGQGR